MPWGIDLVPGINVGAAFNQLLRGGASDPNVDVIPGLGQNEFANSNGIPSQQQVQSAIDANRQRQGQNRNTANTGQTLTASTYQGAYSGGGGSSYDPNAEIARLQIEQSLQQANDALGRVDSQQNTALGNIGGSYNSAYNRLLGQQAAAKRDFETNQEQQLQDYQSSRDSISNNTRNLLLNTRRLLGAQGAGGGSADRYAAPNAAQTEGSNQNAIVQRTNARNLAALNTAREDNERNLNNSFADLNTQRDSSERGIRSQFEQQRADLLNTIAQLTGQKTIAAGGNYQQALAASQPYSQRIGSILNNIDTLAANPATIREQAVTLARPDLAQYTFDRFTAPQANAPAQQDPSLSPGVAALLGLDDQRRQQQLV